MDCRQIQSRLIDYLDGDLRPGEHGAVESHLPGCAACTAELAALAAFDAECTEFLVAPHPDYTTEDLLHRMAAVDPIDEVSELLPQIQVSQTAPRFALATMMLFLGGNFGYAARQFRAVAEQREAVVVARLNELESALVEAEGGFRTEEQA